MAQHASYIAGGVGYQPSDMMQRDNDWVNPGVISSSDLVVTPGTGLSVNVSGAAQGSVGGGAWLPNGYRFYNDSTATIALAAANATYARIDLIVAAIDTSQNPYVPEIIAITGTPAASPVVPTVPGTLVYIPLAQVYVAANATTISTGNITDVRVIAVLDGTIPYNITTNSGNAYSVTLPNIIALTDGLAIRVKFNTSSSGAITLNVNGLGAKSVIDYFGNAVTNVRSNLIANLVYESTSGSFTLQGKGGGGNTIASHVLLNDTCTTDSGPVTGAMPNNGAVNITPSASAQVIPAGYHNGSGSVAAVSVPVANVLSGTTIAGQAGTMPENGAVVITPGTSNQTIANGHHNGSGYVKGDSNLASGNILSGKSIFGVAGSVIQDPVTSFSNGTLSYIYVLPLGTTLTSSNSTPTKVKELVMLKSGTISITYNQYSAVNVMSYGQIYKNGVAVGTQQSSNSTTPTEYTQTFSVNAGDLIQMYLWNTNGGTSACSEFTVKIGNNWSQVTVNL